MRVAIGTIDVSDDVKKAIRAKNGGKGHANRDEVKSWVLGKVDELFNDLTNPSAPEEAAAPAEAEETPEQIQSSWREQPASEGSLPEPYAAGDSTPSAAPPVGGSTATTPGFSG